MSKPWMHHDIKIAAQMWKDGHLFPKKVVAEQIGRRLGRTALAIIQREYYYGPTFAGPCCRIVRKREAPGSISAGQITRMSEAARRVPPRIWAERDARFEAAERRDQTARICGDPPPGFSALDALRRVPPPPSPLSAQTKLRGDYYRFRF